jgi:hypothetical protein
MKLGRFVQTLEYFDVIPICSWWRRFRGIEQPKNGDINQMGVILVVAKLNDLTPEILSKLRERNYAIKLICPESDRENHLSSVEPLFLDLNHPDTLTPDLLTNVQCIIYLSHLDLDAGVTNLIYLAERHLQPNSEKIIFDFTQPSLEIANLWGAIDDVVMGGVSDSNITIVERVALFSGNVSTANSGGFASVRTRNLEPRLDLTNYQGIELKVKGDGQRYKLFIRTNIGWDSLAYSYSFDTAYNSWLNVQIPFDQMVGVFRAKTVPSAPPIDLKQICAFQIMLSKFEYDGQLNPQFKPGKFHLEIASIKAYGSNNLPQFILVENGINLSVQEALRKSNLAYNIVPSFEASQLSS